MSRQTSLLALALSLLGCHTGLPEPLSPLTPTPDAAFRAAPPELETPRVMAAPPVEIETLENGMTVMVSEQPASTVSLVYANRAAQEGDDPALYGLAALTARALDEGTRLSDGRELARIRFGGVEPRIGANLSGTTIEVEALGRALVPGVRLLADLVRNPLFEAAGIEAARAELSDRSFGHALDINTQLRGAAYEALTGGVEPNAQRGLFALTDAMVKQFHREKYRPADSALIAVGPVRMADVVAAARTAFGSWREPPRASAEPEALPAEARWVSTKTIEGLMGDGRQAFFVLAMRCAGTADPESAHFDVLGMILANLWGSRAMRAIRHEQGVSYGISARCEQRRNSGILWVEFSVDTRAAHDGLEKVLNEIQRLRVEAVTERELALAKARLRAEIHAERGGSRALANAYLLGRPVAYSDTFLSNLAAVDAAALQRTAQRYFEPSSLGIATYGDPVQLDPSLRPFGARRWWRLERNTQP